MLTYDDAMHSNETITPELAALHLRKHGIDSTIDGVTNDVIVGDIADMRNVAGSWHTFKADKHGGIIARHILEWLGY